MWWKGLIVAIIAVTLVASVIIANKKNIYDPGSYPLLRSQILFFDSRLNGSDDSRYRVMLEVVWLLADYGTSKPVFQECKRLLMQMWHDDYSLLAAQSLEAFIVEGIVIDKKRLPVTTFWKHGTYANAIGMRPDCWKDSFIKVDMRDSKSIGDFLATERTTLAQSYKQAGIQIGPAAQKIGVLGQASDIVPLRNHMQHPDVYVRLAVANALRNLGDDADGRAMLVQMANATKYCVVAKDSTESNKIKNEKHDQYVCGCKSAQILARDGTQ